MPGRVGVGAGHQVDMGGVVGRRGVHLLAVDDVLVAVTHGPALEAGQVCARLRLGEAEGENDVAFYHSRDEFLFLLFGARCQDGRSAAARSADGYADAGELFLNDILLDAAAALPAVFLGPAYADPIALGDLANQFAVVDATPAFFGGFQFAEDIIGNVLSDELLHFPSQGFLLGGISKVHAPTFARRMDSGVASERMPVSLSCERLAVSSKR